MHFVFVSIAGCVLLCHPSMVVPKQKSYDTVIGMNERKIVVENYKKLGGCSDRDDNVQTSIVPFGTEIFFGEMVTNMFLIQKLLLQMMTLAYNKLNK